MSEKKLVNVCVYIRKKDTLNKYNTYKSVWNANVADR